MNTIPTFVLSYLKSLVSDDPTIYEIILTPSSLDWGDVQDITLVSESGMTSRRVFGFTPVTATLTVCHDEEDGCEITQAA